MAFLNKISLVVGTGLFQDFQRILERVKVDSIGFRGAFSSILTGKILASRIAALIHLQTRYWYIRPLCCSLFLGCINLNIPELYIITQNGYHFKCFSGSLGEKSELFKMTVDKLLENPVKCRNSIEKIFKLYKETKKKFNYNFLEISCFSKGNFSQKVPISCNLLNEIQRKVNFN
jgi:20S proteasome alpha/beta subunit